MKRRISAVLGVLLAALLLLVGCTNPTPAPEGSGSGSAGSGQAASTGDLSKLAIIHTNDIHGYAQDSEEGLGYTAVAQLKADLKEQGYEVVLADAGDVLQGTTLVGYYNGENVPELMNAVGYDVMALGNHEFDYGSDVLLKRIEACDFPVLCANLTVDETGEPFIPGTTVVTTESGLKLGFFGLLTPSTKTQSRPSNTAGLTFKTEEDLYACAQEQIDALRAQNVDLVICLSHLGEENDVGANKGSDVVKNTQGIDIMINAHDHAVQNEMIADKSGVQVPVYETGSYLHNIGVITFEDGVPTEKLYAAGEYEGKDAAVKELVDKDAAKLEEDLSEQIGQSAFELNGNRKPGVRDTETNLGDFASDAILWLARNNADDYPDAALINGGGLRTSVPAGYITIKNMLDVMPFGNQLCTVRVTGAQLLEALEAACQSTPEEAGGFPQVSGITFSVDLSVPYEAGEKYPDSEIAAPANPGSRVTISDVGGKGFSLDATYTIATVNFIAEGGDCYYAFAAAGATSFKSIGYIDYQALQYYLAEECSGQVPDRYSDPWGEGRITIVGAEEVAEAA